MNRKKNKVFAAATCCLICLSASGYKFQPFSDLDTLMNKSDLIVLARIAHPIQGEDKPRLHLWDGLVEFEFTIYYNIKGSLPPGRYHVILQSTFIRKYHNLRLGGDRAMLFLTTGNSVAGEKVLMNWSNSGSIMPASPDLDVDKLKGLSEREKVLFVLKDYVEFKEKELVKIKKDISKIK